MSDRLQISVMKEGSYDAEHWSDRTLTIDAATQTVTVSRHHHPQEVYHHSMRVLGIQTWPHIQSLHSHDTAEAKLTIHLMGMKVPVPPSLKADSKSAASTVSGSAIPDTRFPIPAHDAASRESKPSAVDDSWMVRCATAEAHAQAIQLLQQIIDARHQRGDGALEASDAKDMERLQHFPLPSNVTAPGVIPTTRQGPVL